MLTLPDGQRYEGEFRDGWAHGHGATKYPDGRRHGGEYRKGLPHGYGVLTSPEGARYEGEFRNGELNGQGVSTSWDGHRYAGEFRDGEPHGHGVMTFPEGGQYEGVFKEDGWGTGVWTLPDGRRCTVFNGEPGEDCPQPPGDQAMTGRACERPGGCGRGAFREVETGPIGEPGRRWLCLRHAGAVWNARKAANRAAGRCPCGAGRSPGYRTCAGCRERARTDRRRARNVARMARECGVTLPRSPGRRTAFLRAYCEAFNRAQRKGRRRWFRAYHRTGIFPRPVRVTVSVPWEGGTVTVQAHIGEGSDVWGKGVPAGPE